MRFSDRIVPEIFQTFWAAMQRGEFITDAAAEAGTYRKKAAWWLAADGGVRPRRGRNRRPVFDVGAARGDRHRPGSAATSTRAIAASIARSPSTVSRERRRNRDERYPRPHCGSSRQSSCPGDHCRAGHCRDWWRRDMPDWRRAARLQRADEDRDEAVGTQGTQGPHGVCSTARCSAAPASRPAQASGFEGDFVAERFELANVVAPFRVRIDVAVIVVRSPAPTRVS